MPGNGSLANSLDEWDINVLGQIYSKLDEKGPRCVIPASHATRKENMASLFETAVSGAMTHFVAAA